MAAAAWTFSTVVSRGMPQLHADFGCGSGLCPSIAAAAFSGAASLGVLARVSPRATSVAESAAPANVLQLDPFVADSAKPFKQLRVTLLNASIFSAASVSRLFGRLSDAASSANGGCVRYEEEEDALYERLRASHLAQDVFVAMKRAFGAQKMLIFDADAANSTFCVCHAPRDDRLQALVVRFELKAVARLEDEAANVAECLSSKLVVEFLLKEKEIADLAGEFFDFLFEGMLPLCSSEN